MKKALIFDLDGTLLDTLDDLTASVNVALGATGLPLRSRQEVRSFLGNGVRYLMECAVPEQTDADTFEKAFASFRAHYMEHSLDATRPYDGLMEVLAHFKSQEVPMAIVSNKLHEAVVQLHRRFFSQYVDVAVGESPAVRRKPAPDTVLLALKRLGMTPDEAIYVGDSEVDMLTAQNAGLPCISVLWGFRDKDFLEARGAQCMVSEPAQLPEAYEQMCKS